MVGYAYDSNGNITCDPLRCFEIRYNLLNLAAEAIGHDPEYGLYLFDWDDFSRWQFMGVGSLVIANNAS